MAGRDSVFEQRFKNLCSLVASHLKANNPRRALATAAAFLVFRDAATFTSISIAHAKNLGVEFVKRAETRDADLADGQFFDGDAIHGMFHARPLSLLIWLDNKLSVDGVGIPHWATASPIGRVSLTEQERAAVGLNDWLEDIFIFPKTQAHVKAPVEKQTHGHGRYFPRWEVVPAIPDPSQESRRLAVVAPSNTTVSSMKGYINSPQMIVYLAEFAQAPQFLSEWAVCDELTTWKAKGLNNATELAALAREHVRRAFSRNADVIVFPELVVDHKVLQGIKDELRARSLTTPEQAPALVVAGSFHAEVNGQTLNRSLILDAAGNSVMLEDGTAFFHDKLTSVQLSAQRIIEGNDVGHVVTLMCSPIGTHAVAICLDLGQAASADAVPLEKLPIRWLWVPSMSQSVSPHETKSKTICTQRAVTVACANQADADFGLAPSGSSLALSGGLGTSFVYQTTASRTQKSRPVPPYVEGQTSFQIHHVQVAAI